MTSHQLAVAAGATPKWLLNSAALLGRRIRRTPDDAKWWGLLRLLTESLGLPLHAAAGAATRSLRAARPGGELAVIADPSGSASVRIDIGRYESTFLGNLSRALVLETPKRRGRPSRPHRRRAAESALDYGVDLGLVQAALNRTPAERLEMLEANARFLDEMRKRVK